MATASRRALLAGLTATPIAATSLAAGATDPAEVAFMRWLALAGAMNSAGPMEDEQADAMWLVVEEAEDELPRLAPSLHAAAALALWDLPYMIDTPENRDGPSLNDGLASCRPFGEHGRLIFRTLRCLRPQLTGHLLRFVADILDHADRPLHDSELYRTYCGEAQS